MGYYVFCTQQPACTGKDCTARSHTGKTVLHLWFEKRRNNRPEGSSLTSGWVYWAPGAVLGWALVLGSSTGVSGFCGFLLLGQAGWSVLQKIKNLVVQKKRCDSRIFGLCHPLYAGDDKETIMLFIHCPWCHWRWGISRQSEAQLLLLFLLWKEWLTESVNIRVFFSFMPNINTVGEKMLLQNVKQKKWKTSQI